MLNCRGDGGRRIVTPRSGHGCGSPCRCRCKYQRGVGAPKPKAIAEYSSRGVWQIPGLRSHQARKQRGIWPCQVGGRGGHASFQGQYAEDGFHSTCCAKKVPRCTLGGGDRKGQPRARLNRGGSKAKHCRNCALLNVISCMRRKREGRLLFCGRIGCLGFGLARPPGLRFHTRHTGSEQQKRSMANQQVLVPTCQIMARRRSL